MNFETVIPAKWVLAGEHAVLRGATAIALPHPDFHLKLTYEPGGDRLDVRPADLTELVESLVDDFLRDETVAGQVARLGGRSSIAGAGRLRLESSIPIGGGLGSSAALCVAVCRWLSRDLDLDDSPFLKLATRLENRFHGKSSGMDVAVTALAAPLAFRMGEAPRVLPIAGRMRPRFTFHDTALRVNTRECVARVQTFGERDPEAGRQADARMAEASHLAEDGLLEFASGKPEGLARGTAKVAEAMNLAHECFEQWGLIPEQVRELRSELLHQGALGVKLTGAGAGGFLVAVWPAPTLA